MSGYRPDNGFDGLMKLVRKELEEASSMASKPTPQNMKTVQEPQLDAEDIGMEDYSEEDLNSTPPKKSPKSKSKDDDRYAVRRVPDKEVQNPAPKKEFKVHEYDSSEGEGLRPKVTRKLQTEGPGDRKYYDILVNGVKIGTQEEYRDYVKAKETDRLRTKMTSLTNVIWDQEGIQKVFGQNVTVGHSPARYSNRPQPDVANIYRRRGKMSVKDLEWYLPNLPSANSQENPAPKKESKITEKGDLYLCNNCFKTFRNTEPVCTECRSNIVEKIVEDKADPSVNVRVPKAKKLPPPKKLFDKERDIQRQKNYTAITGLHPKSQESILASEKVIDEKGWFYREGDRLKSDSKFQQLLQKYGSDSVKVEQYVAQLQGASTSKDILKDLIKYAAGELEEESVESNEEDRSEQIANAIARALQPLGYWHTETVDATSGTHYEFIVLDGPKVKVFVEKKVLEPSND